MTADSTTRARGRPKTFDRCSTLDAAKDSYWRDSVDPEVDRGGAVGEPKAGSNKSGVTVGGRCTAVSSTT